MNTYTNHPAYQEPLKRSAAHNKLRFFLGVVVMLTIAIPLIAGSALSFPYSIYQLGAYIWGGEYVVAQTAANFISPFIAVLIFFIGIRFFQWGRHLTRPNSREFA